MTCKTCENELPENEDRFLPYCSEQCLDEDDENYLPMLFACAKCGRRFMTRLGVELHLTGSLADCHGEEHSRKFTDEVLSSKDLKDSYPFSLSDWPTFDNPNGAKYGQYTVKPKKDNTFEYFVLYLISGFVGMKALAIFDSNTEFTQQDSRYLYLAAFMLILNLFSAAKANIFNVFLLIRKIPNSIKQLFNHIIKDYRYWKENGVRMKNDS